MLRIETKNSDNKEVFVRDMLLRVVSKYSIPVFSEKVIVEKNAISHSHPTLIIGTKDEEPLLLLKTFVHEQFHWFEACHPRYNEAIGFLKKKYKDLGDCNKGSQKTDSFWQHIIVCWNTRNFLQNNLDKNEIDFIYSASQPYPLTEKFIEENFNEIKEDLEVFDMAYK